MFCAPAGTQQAGVDIQPRLATIIACAITDGQPYGHNRATCHACRQCRPRRYSLAVEVPAANSRSSSERYHDLFTVQRVSTNGTASAPPRSILKTQASSSTYNLLFWPDVARPSTAQDLYSCYRCCGGNRAADKPHRRECRAHRTGTQQLDANLQTQTRRRNRRLNPPALQFTRLVPVPRHDPRQRR
jgi:NAD-dependent dihydropyrimidine dehydrogenase PreA subunit